MADRNLQRRVCRKLDSLLHAGAFDDDGPFRHGAVDAEDIADELATGIEGAERDDVTPHVRRWLRDINR